MMWYHLAPSASSPQLVVILEMMWYHLPPSASSLQLVVILEMKWYHLLPSANSPQLLVMPEMMWYHLPPSASSPQLVVMPKMMWYHLPPSASSPQPVTTAGIPAWILSVIGTPGRHIRPIRGLDMSARCSSWIRARSLSSVLDVKFGWMIIWLGPILTSSLSSK